uniref:Transmembrane protein n=1 Tax=Junco hyemalis TaxID=40217 RepID=A0A8C5JHD6_JUNHY
MERHSEEAPRKASLFKAGTEMKNPTSGTPTGLLFPKHLPSGKLSTLKLVFFFLKSFTAKVVFLFLVTTVLFIRPQSCERLLIYKHISNPGPEKIHFDN